MHETNSMQHSPSWKANRSLANQDVPRNLWNPNADRRFHKSPPLVPILGEINPIHTLLSCFLEDQFLYCAYKKGIIGKSYLSFCSSLNLSAACFFYPRWAIFVEIWFFDVCYKRYGRIQFYVSSMQCSLIAKLVDLQSFLKNALSANVMTEHNISNCKVKSCQKYKSSSPHLLLTTCWYPLGAQFITSLRSNLRTSVTTYDTQCSRTHTQNTASSLSDVHFLTGLYRLLFVHI